MSIFRPLAVACPACSQSFEMQASESVNADRRPDFRQAVIDGSFQREKCPKCGEQFRLDPALNYIDVGRGQWISVQPLTSLGNWVELEDQALAAFSRAYGAEAPASAREIGAALSPRLVFGWAAFREKLVAVQYGFDDVMLELLKLALIQGLGDVPLAAGNELRLEGVDGEELELNWVKAESEQIVERMRVPRAMYDGIVNDTEAWAPVRKSLEEGPFIDMQKLYMGQGRRVPITQFPVSAGFATQ